MRSRGLMPLTIEGNSYFDLPRNEHTQTPSSLITPVTFMDASSAKTPESQKPADETAETPEIEPASGAKQPIGDVILLVEDNAINMRVRHSTSNPTFECHEALSCQTCSSTTAIGETFTDRILTSC